MDKGELREDLAPFVDEIKILVVLPDGTICDVSEGNYRQDNNGDGCWALKAHPRTTKQARSALGEPDVT